MVAPLPPLPKKRTKSQIQRDALGENLRALPPLSGRWGSLTVGGWAETKAGDATEVVGRCHKCGEIRNAIDLRWEDGPFGQDGGWTCFDTCLRKSNVLERRHRPITARSKRGG